MSKLEEHAERELRAAGLFDKDSDYDGAIGEQVMKLIRALDEGHSGGSMSITLAAFDRVVRFKTLTPITSDPAEWIEIDKGMRSDPAVPVWQNRRQSSCFSTDGGQTHYDIDAGDERAIKTSEPPR